MEECGLAHLGPCVDLGDARAPGAVGRWAGADANTTSDLKKLGDGLGESNALELDDACDALRIDANAHALLFEPGCYDADGSLTLMARDVDGSLDTIFTQVQKLPAAGTGYGKVDALRNLARESLCKPVSYLEVMKTRLQPGLDPDKHIP